jgi:signal transduction histidine kinase
MSGRRRVQRSVRITVAVGLVVCSAVLVAVAAIASDPTSLLLVAAGSVGLGIAAVRVMYAEVVQTRREAARGRAEQARAFGAVLSSTYADHARFTALIVSRLSARTRRISELNGTIRLADKRADQAEARADRESARADREAARADDAHTRLSTLLDDVLSYQVAPVDPLQGEPSSEDLPTVVDLLRWEERTSAATSHGQDRKQA